MYKSRRAYNSKPTTPLIRYIDLPDEEAPGTDEGILMSECGSSSSSVEKQLSHVEVELHRSILLPAKSNSLSKPHALFDVARPTCFIRLWLSDLHPSPISDFHRRKLISRTHFKSIIIKCPDFMPLWKITVQADTGVTCGDVFEAIFKFLRQPMTEEDMNSISDAKRVACMKSFVVRCLKKAVDLPDKERKAGLLYVDYLCGKTMFGGLALDPTISYAAMKLFELHCLMNLAPSS